MLCRSAGAVCISPLGHVGSVVPDSLTVNTELARLSMTERRGSQGMDESGVAQYPGRVRVFSPPGLVTLTRTARYDPSSARFAGV